MTENGDLIVLNVDKYAAGNYTCRATNMAGSRDTPPAIVWVYGKFQPFCRDPWTKTCRSGDP